MEERRIATGVLVIGSGAAGLRGRHRAGEHGVDVLCTAKADRTRWSHYGDGRHELQLHCYRIVGSLQDAEDLVQETLLAAWRNLGAFEGELPCAPGCTGSRRAAA